MGLPKLFSFMTLSLYITKFINGCSWLSGVWQAIDAVSMFATSAAQMREMIGVMHHVFLDLLS